MLWINRCVPEDFDAPFSICIAPTCEESCLQYASCEADIDGYCGWQGSTEYEDCLAACNPPATEPTLPPICAVVLCESPESRCASATCDGCNADDENIVCSVEDCDASPCCGCLTFRIGGRNVTGECNGGRMYQSIDLCLSIFVYNDDTKPISYTQIILLCYDILQKLHVDVLSQQRMKHIAV